MAKPDRPRIHSTCKESTFHDLMCRIGGSPDATGRLVVTIVPLNGELLKGLILSRFPGGVTALQDAWNAAFGDACGDGAGVPDRSTIYRWRQGKWPGNKSDLLKLSSLLDVDPLCLLDITEDAAPDAMKSLYRSYQTNRWAPRARSVLGDFLGHKTDWPPKSLAKHHYDRDWRLREVGHDLTLGCNFYPTFEIAGAPAVYEDRPQVFHFAYRHAALFGRQWVQYGFVLRHGGAVRLISINGHVENRSIDARDAPTLVETWFGPSPTVFRIASLHDFDIHLRTKDTTGEIGVRFPA